MRRFTVRSGVLLGLCLGVSTLLHAASALAPGYAPLAFKAPIPGSYSLPLLGTAGDGQVLTTQNQDLQLHHFMGDKVVLLSFIYATCSDVNGCPLALAVLHKLKDRLQDQPEVADQLRLITLSFNPEHDTPEHMQHLAQELQGSGAEWQFLTTRGEQQLQPILQQYPQNIQKVMNAQGQFTGSFNHNLRVYLIDKQKHIRNIYSASFLHADTVLNDIQTLLLAEHAGPASENNPATPERYTAGDDKTAYTHSDYHTHSVALTQRQGQVVDLWALAQQPLLGLPALPVPANNPLTPAKIALGRKLFYDRRLSLNNTLSCAMCHIPEQGFSNNEMATAVGVEGRSVNRNAPTLYNVAYAQKLFHDGREDTLEQQAWGPLLATNEMANPSIAAVLTKIKRSPDYAGLFESSFGAPVGMENLGMALASYQRVLNSADSPFDRWYFAKQADALSPTAQRGFALFTGKAGCSACHTLTAEYALFSDQQLHNTGVGYAASMTPTESKRQLQIAPGRFIEVDRQQFDSLAEPKVNDLGAYAVTQNPKDRWHYKTPSLRNISLSAPYMHNGVFSSLAEVIAFYNRGGIPNENLDPLIRPLHLSVAEQAELLAFLETLTGSNVNALVADGFAAPIGQ